MVLICLSLDSIFYFHRFFHKYPHLIILYEKYHDLHHEIQALSFSFYSGYLTIVGWESFPSLSVYFLEPQDPSYTPAWFFKEFFHSTSLST